MTLPLLMLAPVMSSSVSAPTLFAYLSLPAYLVHQYEEHDDGRFGRFINGLVPAGKRGLSQSDIFWINFAGVWLVITLSILLSHFVAPGFSLIAAWLLLFNAALHMLQAVLLRRYNPGLISAVIVFVPLGLLMLFAVPTATLGLQAICLGLVILLHAGILARAMSSKPDIPNA